MKRLERDWKDWKEIGKIEIVLSRVVEKLKRFERFVLPSEIEELKRFEVRRKKESNFMESYFMELAIKIYTNFKN